VHSKKTPIRQGILGGACVVRPLLGMAVTVLEAGNDIPYIAGGDKTSKATTYDGLPLATGVETPLKHQLVVGVGAG
jgi:hypothetical protein